VYDFRPATREDAAIVAMHRHKMFLGLGHADDDALKAVTAAFLPWVREAITRGTYLGYLATLGHQVAAGAGMMVMDWPPSPRDPSPAPQRGYVFNAFTEPDHRRRGLCGQLVRMALEEAKMRGIAVVTLHTAPGTQALYESLGFRINNEMIWSDEG
jgi:ribosomal protein S18 acetylase RimI-like enzyme